MSKHLKNITLVNASIIKVVEYDYDDIGLNTKS